MKGIKMNKKYKQALDEVKNFILKECEIYKKHQTKDLICSTKCNNKCLLKSLLEIINKAREE